MLSGQITTGTLIYTVTGAEFPGPLTNTVLVTGTTQPTGTLITANDDASVDLMEAYSELGIEKTATSSIIDDTITITYTITISNNSETIAATDVVISDTLPTGVNFVISNTTNSSSYNPVNGIWDVGTVGVSTNVTLTYIVTDHLVAGQIITNTAVLSTSIPSDSDTKDNSDSVSVTVTGSNFNIHLPIILKTS